MPTDGKARVGSDAAVPTQRAPAEARTPAGSGAAPTEPKRTGPARRRRRTSVMDKILIGIGLVVILVTVVGAVGVNRVNHVFGEVQRIPDVFGPLDPAARPAKPTGTGNTINFLIVGVDAHAGDGSTDADAAAAGRRGAIMLVHVAAGRRSAAVVTIPGNSLVPVPGRRVDRVDTAYPAGGGTLLVRTVEQLTSLRIDHFGVLDFAGITGVADALGGVDVGTPVSPGTASAGGGQGHLDGPATLAYLRRGDGRPGTELDQIRRQHAVIRALMTKATARGLFSSPTGTLRIAGSAARAISVDDSLSNGDLRSLVLSLRNLKAGKVAFVIAPVDTASRRPGDGAVRLDAAAAPQLWQAIGRDDVAGYVRAHPPGNPR